MQGTDGNHWSVLGVFVSVPRDVAGTAGSTNTRGTWNIALVLWCTAVSERGNEQKLKPVFPRWMPRASFQRTVMAKLLVAAGLRLLKSPMVLWERNPPKVADWNVVCVGPGCMSHNRHDALRNGNVSEVSRRLPLLSPQASSVRKSCR